MSCVEINVIYCTKNQRWIESFKNLITHKQIHLRIILTIQVIGNIGHCYFQLIRLRWSMQKNYLCWKYIILKNITVYGKLFIFAHSKLASVFLIQGTFLDEWRFLRIEVSKGNLITHVSVEKLFWRGITQHLYNHETVVKLFCIKRW